MEENKNSYFGGIRDGLKSLATGLGVTFREYLTKKVTEQYPENRKTTLHVSPRHRGRSSCRRMKKATTSALPASFARWLVLTAR